VSVAKLYLPPVLSMVALSLLVALTILVTRSSDLLAKRKTIAYYEDWDGTGASVSVMRPTRQLANLFEFPVLFYTAVAMIVAVGVSDAWLQRLCWTYAAMRWAHALIHVTVNRLWIRTPVFIVSQFVLLALWGRLAVVVLGGA
jgi:hypothetical protein